jgi:deoxyribonuclease I
MKNLNLFILLFLFSSPPSTWAQISTSNRLKNLGLKNYLHLKLKEDHLNKRQNNQYKQTRKILFGLLFLKGQESTLQITDVYCQMTFGEEIGIGEFIIPNHKILNTEHTWPKSRFSKVFSYSKQKNDLHHLFPTHNGANGLRGNLHFGEPTNNTISPKNCPKSLKGYNKELEKWLFMPPFEQRGNTARALFYFSIRYKVSIPSFEEKTLKRWHSLDPVDDSEIFRNNRIMEIQGNRNPFIDDPELPMRIDDF